MKKKKTPPHRTGQPVSPDDGRIPATWIVWRVIGQSLLVCSTLFFLFLDSLPAGLVVLRVLVACIECGIWISSWSCAALEQSWEGTTPRLSGHKRS